MHARFRAANAPDLQGTMPIVPAPAVVTVITSVGFQTPEVQAKANLACIQIPISNSLSRLEMSGRR